MSAPEPAGAVGGCCCCYGDLLAHPSGWLGAFRSVQVTAAGGYCGPGTLGQWAPDLRPVVDPARHPQHEHPGGRGDGAKVDTSLSHLLVEQARNRKDQGVVASDVRVELSCGVRC